MDRPGSISGRILVATSILLAGASLSLAQTPTNLRAEGVVNNRHVLSHTPQLCWDFTGTQTNWQIQADDDPNYTGNPGAAVPGQLWYWDSGDQDKGTANDDRCAVFRQILKPGFVPVSLDRRAHSSYWRLRVQVNGTTWGPWVETEMRMNQFPQPALNMAVQADGVSSTDPVMPVPAKVTGRTFYVSPTGSDTNAGTQTAPFKTLNHATLALAKGDTLLVRGGVYNENVLISSGGGHANGEPNNPITVKAYTGETPIVRALSSGTRTALEIQGPTLRLTDWVIDGLTIGGASTLAGIHLNGVANVTVKNCRFENTLTPYPTASVESVLATGNSEDLKIIGCVFNQMTMNQVHVSGAKHVEIRNNEFTNSGRMGIIGDGHYCPNMVIADNRFHDASPDQAMVALYYGSEGSRVVNNVFANVLAASGKLAWGILELRSGKIAIENNTFYRVEGSGLMLREWTSFGSHRNNIFMNCGVAVNFVGGILPGSATTDSVVDYNIFYQNANDIAASASELAMLNHAPVGNCLGGPSPSNPACDPKFVDAVNQDFRLQTGSPAIDAGDPLSPIPIGGGLRVDVGRFEFGAAATPYDYISKFSTSDSTPRITWGINDADNELERLFNDLPPGDTDYQTKYQLQIDPKNTFDSLGGIRPMLDTDVVASPTEGFTVPDTRSLAPGEYYVRVRQWDDEDIEKGAWSDHNLRFRVGGEPQPPYAASENPAPGAVGVIQTTSVVLHVKDDGVGVNLATVKLYVNGVQVTPVVTGSLNDYTLTYTPSVAFAFGSTVTVRIVADDLQASPPTLDFTYRFTIRDNTPPQPPTNVRVQ